MPAPSKMNVVNFSDKLKDVPFGSFADWALSSLRRHAAEGEIAQIFADDDTSWTYSELLNNSVQVACGLPKVGITNGDMVSFVTLNGHELYAVVLGCIFNNITVVPSVAGLTAAGLKQNFDLVKPKFVVVGKEFLPAVEEAINGANPPLDPKPQIFELKQLFKETVAKGADDDPATYKPIYIADAKSHVFAYLFSSGTTGKQKAVSITDYGFIRSIYAWPLLSLAGNNPYQYGYYNATQINWVSWWFCLSRALAAGWCRIFMNKVDASCVLDTIQKYKISLFSVPPRTLTNMVPEMDKYPGRWDVSSIPLILTGGTTLNKFAHERLVRKLNIPIHQQYGSTEFSMVTVGAINEPVVYGSIGRPYCPIKLIDPETGEDILEPNVPGEIVCKWTCTNGYLNNPEATAAAYDKNGWFKSGDIATFNEAGDFFMVDRIKEMFKCYGYQISPSELEEIIIKIPGVLDAAVAGKDVGLPVDYVPTALVVKAPGLHVSEEDINKFVEKEIVHDSRKLRGGIIFIDSIPRTPTGKPDRVKIRNIVNES